MTSSFGSKQLRYCVSKVLFRAKKLDQWFFPKLRKTRFPQWKSSPSGKIFSEFYHWGRISTGGIAFFLICGKTIGPISQLYKSTLDKQYLSYLEPKGEVICCKIGPFLFQNSNGRGGFNFRATPFLFWNSISFFKLFKRHLHNILLSLMISDLAKSVRSVPSILEQSLSKHIPSF